MATKDRRGGSSLQAKTLSEDLDRGNYVVVWKKDGVPFKLHRDIWTTSMPPAK